MDFVHHYLDWKHIRKGYLNGQCKQEEVLQQEKPFKCIIIIDYYVKTYSRNCEPIL